jgi:hypothetical protein
MHLLFNCFGRGRRAKVRAEKRSEMLDMDRA